MLFFYKECVYVFLSKKKKRGNNQIEQNMFDLSCFFFLLLLSFFFLEESVKAKILYELIRTLIFQNKEKKTIYFHRAAQRLSTLTLSLPLKCHLLGEYGFLTKCIATRRQS